MCSISAAFVFAGVREALLCSLASYPECQPDLGPREAEIPSFMNGLPQPVLGALKGHVLRLDHLERSFGPEYASGHSNSPRTERHRLGAHLSIVHVILTRRHAVNYILTVNDLLTTPETGGTLESVKRFVVLVALVLAGAACTSTTMPSAPAKNLPDARLPASVVLLPPAPSKQCRTDASRHWPDGFRPVRCSVSPRIAVLWVPHGPSQLN
jgi:hypothetical protein